MLIDLQLPTGAARRSTNRFLSKKQAANQPFALANHPSVFWRKTTKPLWLVVYLPPLKKYLSVGMIIPFPTEWKVIKAYKIHVPNHQPALLSHGSVRRSEPFPIG